MRLKLSDLVLIPIVVLAALLVILGNIFLLKDQQLSQTYGYVAFLLFAISTIIIFTVHKSGNKKILEEISKSGESVKYSNLKFWLFNVVAASFLILVVERSIIFSNSIIPNFLPNLAEIRASLNPFSLFSGFLGNGQGFIVQSFYMNWEAFLPLSTGQYDKLALFTEIFFYYMIAAAVSRTFYRVIGIKSLNETLISVIFASLFIFNFIYYSAGYGSFILGPLMIAYVVMKYYEAIKTENFRFFDALRVGLAISFAVFGDPRSLVYFVLILIGFSIGLIVKYRNQFSPFFKFSLSSLLVIIPMFAVEYLMVSYVPVFAANAGRAGDYSSIAFFSSATQPMFIWNFMANWWSGFTLSPPSLLNVPSSGINGLSTIYAGNAILIYLPSTLNSIWTLSLGTISILAISSILLMRNDQKNPKLSLLFLPFLVMFSLTLGTNVGFKPFVEFVAFLSTIPVIGSFWAVTVSTPQWIDQYLTPFFIIFAAYSLLRVSQILENTENKKGSHSYSSAFKKIKAYRKYGFVFAVLFLFLFANWQFFEQNYALGQELPGNLPGNQVSSTPSLVPVNPPPGWLSAYDSLYNPNNLSYAVYTNDGALIPLTWDNGSNSFTEPGIPPNPSFSNLFNEIVSLNMSYLIPSLLSTYGVKYIFFDKSQLNPNWAMFSVLESSGLNVISSTNNYTIFECPNATQVYPASLAISSGSSSELGSIELIDLFNSIGIRPVIVNQSVSSINFASNNTNTASPQGYFLDSNQISLYRPVFGFNGFSGSYSGTSNADNFPIGNGWNITRFNGLYYVNYSVNGGSLSLQKYDNGTGKWPQSVYNLYYGNGTVPVNAGDSVILNYSFTYSADSSYGNIEFSALQNSVNLPTGVHNKTVSGTLKMGVGIPSFTYGFALNKYNGSFQLKNVNISYSFPRNGMLDKSSFAQTIHVKPDTNYTILYMAANGNMSALIGSSHSISDTNGSLSYTVSGFHYLGSLAIFPTKILDNISNSNLNVTFSQYGSGIEGEYAGSGGYVVLSYNSQYPWIVSKNMHYVSTNSLGQDVYYVNGPGSISFSIRNVEHYIIMDWSAAIFLNIGLPLSIFTKVGSSSRPLKIRIKMKK